MPILFDALGAIVVWLCLFKADLLGTLTTAPLGTTLSKLTAVDIVLLAFCFVAVSLLSRLAEKYVFKRGEKKAASAR
jgi:hypothetical protein